MKKYNYILILISTSFFLVLIFAVSFFYISFDLRNNFYKIQDYFKQTKSTHSNFIMTYDYLENDTMKLKKDTVEIIERIKKNDSTFSYFIKMGRLEIDLRFSLSNFEVVKDSIGEWSIMGKCKYHRATEDLFTIPEFKKCPDNYDKPNEYRAYLSMDKDDLIIHREYRYKTIRKWSFYFSKKNGLYKIIEDEGGMIELKKIIYE
jgi:hypothetical protein